MCNASKELKSTVVMSQQPAIEKPVVAKPGEGSPRRHRGESGKRLAEENEKLLEASTQMSPLKKKKDDRPRVPFDQLVMEKVEAGPCTIEGLEEALQDDLENPGPFAELRGSRRIRALLIVFKSQKKVVQVDGEWRSARHRSHSKSGEPHSPPASRPGPGSIKEMSLADFYLFVKARAGPDRPM
jgi:hypothetical protein